MGTTPAPVYEQAGAAERAFRVLKALPTDAVASGRGFWTHPGSTGIQITETGESAPHENRPPFRALNYIIKY